MSANRLAELRSLLFHFLDGTQLIMQPDEVMETNKSQHYTLLLVVQGACSLYVDDKLIPALERNCYLLAPEQGWYMANYSEDEIVAYVLSFNIFNVATESRYTKPLWSNLFEFVIFPYEKGLKIMTQLVDEKEDKKADAGAEAAREEYGWLKRQQLFLELVSMLLEQSADPIGAGNSSYGGNPYIAYIEQNYMEPLSIKQLAQQAGMSVASYGMMIKQLTGVTPLEYVNEVRIKHAKRLLLATNEPLREIARKTGFADEYYFIRRFRQLTGIAPRHYSRLMEGGKMIVDDGGHKLAIPVQPQKIVYYGELLGDLWSLGVQPVGSNRYGMDSSWLAEDVDLGSYVEDIGIPFQVGRVRALEPDLIILSSMDEQLYSQASQIAPTIAYDSYMPLERRLPRLAGWLDRQAQGQAIIESCQAELKLVQHQLRQFVQQGETASVFIYHRGRQLFVMGGMGLSELLYSTTCWQPTSEISGIIDNNGAYKLIDEQQLAEYAGDYVFIPLPSNATSRQATMKLLKSETWRKLAAVQQGRAYVVDEAKWNVDDAYSRIRQLQHLAAMIQGQNSEKL